jgi:hypothetical protein
MKTDTQKYLDDLLAQGEHQQQDFKFQINNAAKIAISIVAFANTKGGKLLVGVKDNAKVAGIRTEEEIYMIDAAVSMYCKPKIDYQLKSFFYSGKRILEVDVMEGTEKPYMAKDSAGKFLAYFRLHDENILANAVQIKLWNNQKKNEKLCIKYSKEHQLLLHYLKSKRQISFTEAKKLTKLKHYNLIDLLAELISIKVLRLQFIDNIAVYSLEETTEIASQSNKD